MSNHSVTETVRAISNINLTSAGYSLIPWPWYEHVTITKENRYSQEVKYPDLLGLSILSYIVFWYTPTVTVDESSQRTNTPRRKFKADKLQCGYQELANRFHASKRQIEQAVSRLKIANLITVELRTLNTGNGILYNVMFVEPVPANIKAITNQTPNRVATKPSTEELVDTQLRGTYTYASTYASTDIDEEKASSSSAGGKAPPAEPPPKARTSTNKSNSKNKFRGDLEQYFAEISNIPLPKCETKTQKTKAAVRWWNPLAEILEMTDWNLTRAQSLVNMAYKQMKKDELTIAAPQSILSVAISLHADGRVGANGKRTIQV